MSQGSFPHSRRFTLRTDNAGYNAAMRVSALIGALLGWFALLLQLYLMLVQSPAGAKAMLGTVITPLPRGASPGYAQPQKLKEPHLTRCAIHSAASPATSA